MNSTKRSSEESTHSPDSKKQRASMSDADLPEDDESKNDSGRSKLACVRCRRRKTKCSGSIPCNTCLSGGFDCVFYKKPRVIKVLDTKIQEYEDRIEALAKELELAKTPNGNTPGPSSDQKGLSESASPAQALQDSPGRPSSSSSNKLNRLNLSIWLGSPSPELICWNLKQFKISSSDPTKSTEEIIISPNFSSFHEETTYDALFQVDNLLTSAEVEEILRPLTYSKFIQLFDNVVTFINAGYLIVDTDDFIRKGSEYFNFDSPNQEIKMNEIDFQDESKRFFLLKMVTILALGEIYGTKSYVGITEPDLSNARGKWSKYSTRRWESLPGSDYFRVVIKHIPSSFSFITFCSQPLGRSFEIIEMFDLCSLYLRIIDKKNAAVLFTLNSLQLCISLNLHKENHLRSSAINEKSLSYIDKIWWSSFCLNRFFSTRIAQPLLLSLKEIRDFDNKEYLSESGSNSLPFLEKNKMMQNIISKYNFSSSSSMKYYVKLAKISDRITSDLYCVKLPFDNKVFLQSILKIIESLVQWVNDLPSHLKLKLPMIIKDNASTNRLICSLHLNYLHHIYLASIPVLLNFVRMKIFNFYKFKKLILNPIQLNEIPKNISNLLHMLIKSCQLTINIFMTLYRQRYLRVFGFTDLDFLFSCSLVFLICLILGVDKQKFFPFDEYLEISMNIMYEMILGGNLVAKGKLNQILDLLREIEELLTILKLDNLFVLLKRFENNNYVNTPSSDKGKSQSEAWSQLSPFTSVNTPTPPQPVVSNLPQVSHESLDSSGGEIPQFKAPAHQSTKLEPKQGHSTMGRQFPVQSTHVHYTNAYGQGSDFGPIGGPSVTDGFQSELKFGFEPINGAVDFSFITNDQLYGFNDNVAVTDLRIVDEDIEFMNQILQGYDSRLS